MPLLYAERYEERFHSLCVKNSTSSRLSYIAPYEDIRKVFLRDENIDLPECPSTANMPIEGEENGWQYTIYPGCIGGIASVIIISPSIGEE